MNSLYWLFGVVPPLQQTAANAVWAAIHEAAPLAWIIEATPSSAGPWRLARSLIVLVPVPTEAHYAEVAALNPGLRALAWGEL